MARVQSGRPTGNLTKRQRVVFDYIKGYIETHGVSPSYEEIRRNFGFGSYNSVWGNQKRALTLAEPGPSTTVLPLLGRVAAGRPIEAIAHPETVEVPEMLLRGEDNFALRVVGDSMVDEGIRDGDIVIVKRQRDAENGQTVVALIGDDATIKQYYRRGARVELRPANPRMSAIVVDEGDLQLQGIVVGLIRKFHR